MPFHFHSSSSQSQQQQQQHDAASGIYQAAQALGSIGAPSNNLRTATSGSTTAGTDALYSHSQAQGLSDSAAAHSAHPPAYPPGQPRNASSLSANSSSYASNVASVGSAMSHSQQFDTPCRQQTYGRHPDELHLAPASGASAQRGGPMSPREYAATGAPQISLEHATPETSQYRSGGGAQLPSTLQPGGRPALNSTNIAPVGAALQQQNMAQQQQDPYATPSRAATLTTSHGYSRSSPSTAYDAQPYGPFATSGDGSQFSSPTAKYTPSGQQRTVSSTPLGLADIRPRTESGLPDISPGANPYSFDGANATPTNSNYLAPWAVYAFDWCKWPAQNHDTGKVALGSYLEDGHNFIQILESQITATPAESYVPGGPKYGIEFTKIAEATHSYPVTRLLWEPPSSQKQSTDLLATSGDHLRLWSLPADTPMASPGNSINRSSAREQAPASKLTPLALLSNSKTPEHTAPLTSLDWNTVSPSLIITSSIDTTCTIWDIPTLTAKTQLIAHDKEVFDVRFCANSVDVFVSCGADGSVRMFDLRSLEHSTIIYEPTAKDDKDANPGGGRISPTLAQQTMSNPPPLLRLAASPHDTHLLATFSQDSNLIRILDVRQPGQALLELRGHSSSINCIEWSPSRRGTLASGADDSLVLIWDLLAQSSSVAPPAPTSNGGPNPDNSRGPSASWRCDYEVGNISWAPHSALNSEGGDWLGVSGGRGIWGVKL